MTEPARRTLITATAALLVASTLVVGTRSFAASSAPTAASSRLPVRALKIMNYYPARAGWTDMWTDYSHATTVADFAAIASLDANTVRIIVQPDAVGYPIVQPSKLADLNDMIDVASADGLSVQLTLFDMWHRYTDVAGSKQWVTSLLAGLANDPRIVLVELQNEMPLTSAAISWAEALMPFLQQVLPGVPRTISEPGSGGVWAIRKLLSSLPPSDIDAVDVHYYGNPAAASAELKQVTSMANGKPVFIGEAGRSTYGKKSGEEDQARFFEIMGETAKSQGLPPPAPWMLTDVIRAGWEHLNAHETYFGLRRVNGSWKPAAAVVRDLFQGKTPDNWDGDMTSEFLGDGTVLGAWTEFDAPAGVPVVSSEPSYGQGNSICYSHTGGDPAKLPAVEQSFPVLSRGETFTVSAWIERTAGTGYEQISIAGFKSDGSYVGEVDSATATGSGRWQQLYVKGKAPAGASWVEINLKAGYESGTACWSGVNINTGAK